MLYNVFDLIPTSEQVYDYDFWRNKVINENGFNSKYWDTTTHWANIWQRATDGKFVYAVCPDSDSTHNQEEYSDDWVAA